MLKTISKFHVEIYEEKDSIPQCYVLEAIDEEGDGDIIVVRFVGPDAKGLAEEYASFKFENFTLL